jgi:hypothetical protein
VGMEAAAVVGAGGAGLTRWQAAALSAVAGWVWAASFYDLTRRARALVQPWVTRRVHAETPAILTLQVRPLPRHLCAISVLPCPVCFRLILPTNGLTCICGASLLGRAIRCFSTGPRVPDVFRVSLLCRNRKAW